MVLESDIPWDMLQTTDDFDTGGDEARESTELVRGGVMEEDIVMVNTPVSLLVQSLIHQLCSMLEQDHARATTLYGSICQKLHEMKLLDKTYTMGEFEFIRSQYQQALQQLVKAVNEDNLPVVTHTAWPPITSASHSWSRYLRDFEEIKFIAKGGFGTVVMAKHRLDQVDYAIKKIYIKSCEVKSVMNHLAEVKTLASLDHPNIVSYKSAWLEPFLEEHYDDNLIDDSRKDVSTSIASSSYLSHNGNAYNQLTAEKSDFEIHFEYSNEEQIQKNNDKTVETVESCKALCKLDDSKKQMRLVVEPLQFNLKWATLYIQMSLCDKTMETWLKERNQINSADLNCPGVSSCNGTINSANFGIKTVVKAFSQLSKGLHYIHGCKIVHHDIKPRNIFIECQGEELRVRLGDFGLACPLQKSHKGIAIGTQLYAAPEQMLGECNCKSDLFSIGLILLEMIETFKTDMEKAKNFTELRNGKIPAHVTAKHPELAHIISKLVQQKTQERIDTNELLELLDKLKENNKRIIKTLEEKVQSLNYQVNSLKDDVNKKDCEIMEKDKEIMKKDNEIMRLKMKLLELQAR